MIDKSQKDALYRLCTKADESIDHVVSGFSELAQKEYKRKHDNLGKTVHWKLARKCNFEARDKWYEHEPENVLENEDLKTLFHAYNFIIKSITRSLILFKKPRKMTSDFFNNYIFVHTFQWTSS